jgi:hypothetical protein
MTLRDQVPDLLLAVISILISLGAGVLVYPAMGIWAAPLFLILLFLLLYGSARARGWSSPVTLPVVRSHAFSELFLGLGLITMALAVSWFLGLVISRAFSDVWGILSGLCIFGAVMLVISAARDWK